MAASSASSHVWPAQPLLASSFISDEELDAILEGVYSPGIKKRREKRVRLQTGVKSVDDALGGGLVGGRVVSISGEPGGGSSEVLLSVRAEKHGTDHKFSYVNISSSARYSHTLDQRLRWWIQPVTLTSSAYTHSSCRACKGSPKFLRQ